MDARCPFCWNRNVSLIGHAESDRRSGVRRRLMECGDCEKWYWADSGDEVVRLFEICSTSLVNPSRCLDEVREARTSGGDGIPRRRIGEFNSICSDCLSGRFVPRNSAAHV